jgi:hypothetical protein
MDHACPVCGERFATPPERCFRCENPLTAWWEVERIVREMDAEPPPLQAGLLPTAGGVEGRLASTSARRQGALATALAGAISLGIGMAVGPYVGAAMAPFAAGSRPMDDVRAGAAAPLISPAVLPRVAPLDTSIGDTTRLPQAVTIRYRVQPGDSRWRIAAALLGDGARWTELWTAEEARSPLRSGLTLDVAVADRLGARATSFVR